MMQKAIRELDKSNRLNRTPEITSQAAITGATTSTSSSSNRPSTSVTSKSNTKQVKQQVSAKPPPRKKPQRQESEAGRRCREVCGKIRDFLEDERDVGKEDLLVQDNGECAYVKKVVNFALVATGVALLLGVLIAIFYTAFGKVRLAAQE